MVTVAQICDYIKDHFKWVNFMVWEIHYLNEKMKKKGSRRKSGIKGQEPLKHNSGHPLTQLRCSTQVLEAHQPGLRGSRTRGLLLPLSCPGPELLPGLHTLGVGGQGH